MLELLIKWFGGKNNMKSKKLLLSFLVLLLSGCNTSYHPKKLDPNIKYDDVYLIMGQSNASGVSLQTYLETKSPEIYGKYTVGNEKVLISYDCDNRIENNFVPVKFGFGNNEYCFGPEIGIAETLSQKEETSYIIKATWSGSCLRTEYVNENGGKLKYYKRFIPFIKDQLKTLEKEGKHPRLRGMFWMQGESDSFCDHEERYRQAEQHFYEYLRHDLNKWIYEYFNFVDAYIYDHGICWVNPEIINAAKQSFCDENEHCYCIKTNGEDETAISLYLKCETNETDDLAHYDSLSMLLLGKTAGEYLLK